MSTERLRVLLIEDDEDDYVITRELLYEIGEIRYDLEWISAFHAGRDAVLQGGYDVCLVDFRLGEGTGLDLLREVREHNCRTPMILLTGQGDRETDLAAMQSGAADYLVKSEITASLLERSIRYAMERNRLLEQIRTLSLLDDLTGLYNRRGFFTLAEQQMNVVVRTRQPLVLLFADLDAMKQINDQWGHKAGDQALRETAALLRRTFRKTDVIARMGGDEFAVLAIDAEPTVGNLLLGRLRVALEERNSARDLRYPLSISSGYVSYDPRQERSLDELLAEADALMYQQKQTRRELAAPQPTGTE